MDVNPVLVNDVCREVEDLRLADARHSYQVKVVGQDCQVNVDGKMLNEFNVVIPDQEKQTYNVDFAFNKHGPNQKLEFDLYKSGSSEVYLRTYLKVEVE